MSRKYKINDNTQLYFVTFTVVHWIDLFIRDGYRNIFIDSLKYCQQHKGLEIYAYCIMPSHVHLIIGCNREMELSGIVRDLKSFTSRHIRKLLEDFNFPESRREWICQMFKKAGLTNSNNKDFHYGNSIIIPLSSIIMRLWIRN